MRKKGDHRPRNSAQYERVVELLIMHNAKWTSAFPPDPGPSQPNSEENFKVSRDTFHFP